MGDVVKFKAENDKKVYIIVIVLLLLATAALAYINLAHGAYNKEINLGKTNSIMTVDGAEYIMKKSGDDVVICSHDGISAINKFGEIVWHVDYRTNSPFMETAGDYVLCADLNGSACKVWKNGKEVSEQKLPYEVICATINKNGYYAVASKERGYKSQVGVYSDKGEKIFGWHSTKYHVVAMAVAENNKTMLVSVIDVAQKAESAFKLLRFSFDKDSPTDVETVEGNLVSGITFSNGKFYAVGDMALCAYNENGKKSFVIDYKGRNLQEFAVIEGEAVLGLTKGSVEGYYGGSVVEVYSASGTKKGFGEIDGEITFLDTDGNKILVNAPEGAYILNDKGRVYGKLEFENEVREGMIFSGGEKLLLVNGLNVNVYDSK